MATFSLVAILVLITSPYILSVSEKTISTATLDPGESTLLYKGQIKTRDVGKPAYANPEMVGEARSWIHVRAYIIDGATEKTLSDYYGYGFQITRGQTMYYELHVAVPLATCPGEYSAQVKWYLNYGAGSKELAEIVNLSMSITDDMQEEAQQKIDEAEVKIREVQKKGADVTQAADALNSAKRFLEDSCNCTLAMNYAQSAMTKAGQALNTAMSLARSATLEANIAYNKALKLQLDVREAHTLLYEANLEFEEERYDVALTKAIEAKGMLDEMVNLAERAEEKISEVRAAISQAQGRTIKIGNAEDLLAQAESALEEYKYEQALELGRQAEEEVTYWMEKYDQAVGSIRDAESCIKNTQKGQIYEIKPQIKKSQDMLSTAKSLLEEEEYDNARTSAEDACRTAQEAKEASEELTYIFWPYLVLIVLALMILSFKLY